MLLFLKDEFKKKYSSLTDFDSYWNTTSTFLKKSFRVNTLKIANTEMKKRFSHLNLRQVPWIKEGFWILDERSDFGNWYEHQLGFIYLQEAASMLPAIVLNPGKEDLVLDVAASPGSKTTQMAAMMKNSGLVVANDVAYGRMPPLAHNIQRCGVTNTITTVMDGRRINQEVDKVLLDAPCSGVGTIRGPTGNSNYTMQVYSQHRVKTLSGIQKRLILASYRNLKKKGTMVYSTCSLEPEEDEEVIQFLLDETDAKLEKINLKIKSEVNLDYGEYSSELKKCIKLWPQFYDTEGFFIAKIRKP